MNNQNYLKEVEEKKTAPVKIKWEREVTKFEIVNENEVPRVLCSPDDSKIRKMIDSWITEIQWIKVRKEKVIY